MTRICVNFSNVYNDTLIAKGLTASSHILLCIIHQSHSSPVEQEYLFCDPTLHYIIWLYVCFCEQGARRHGWSQCSQVQVRRVDSSEWLHRSTHSCLTNQTLVSWTVRAVGPVRVLRSMRRKFLRSRSGRQGRRATARDQQTCSSIPR